MHFVCDHYFYIWRPIAKLSFQSNLEFTGVHLLPSANNGGFNDNDKFVSTSVRQILGF